ncbi:MAG: hypothetical protein R3244_04550, partial [Thermoanaerobaculia bacterium]|nr:hypothetical protein [Thermoanaerobaculia bacterium]
MLDARHPIRSHSPLVFLVCALFMVVPFSASAEETLTYVLSEEWTEGNSGGTTVEVRQQGGVAVAAFEGKDEPALVSDPESGIWGAWLEDRPPVFVRLVEPPAELEVGDAIAMSTATTARLDA